MDWDEIRVKRRTWELICKIIDPNEKLVVAATEFFDASDRKLKEVGIPVINNVRSSKQTLKANF